MAKKIDIYYSERSAYYIASVATIKNSEWFNDALQPAYVADVYDGTAYFMEKGKVIGFKQNKERPHPEFKYHTRSKCHVPKRGSDAAGVLANLKPLNVLGFGNLLQFEADVVQHYDMIMANPHHDTVSREEALQKNTVTQTFEVFRCEKQKANLTYGIYRSAIAVGFRVPDTAKAASDLTKAYKNISNPRVLGVVPENAGYHRVSSHVFNQLMGIMSPYNLKDDGTVLEFPGYEFVGKQEFFEFLDEYVTSGKSLPEPDVDAKLQPATLWMPEVV